MLHIQEINVVANDIKQKNEREKNHGNHFFSTKPVFLCLKLLMFCLYPFQFAIRIPRISSSVHHKKSKLNIKMNTAFNFIYKKKFHLFAELKTFIL